MSHPADITFNSFGNIGSLSPTANGFRRKRPTKCISYSIRK